MESTQSRGVIRTDHSAELPINPEFIHKTKCWMCLMWSSVIGCSLQQCILWVRVHVHSLWPLTFDQEIDKCSAWWGGHRKNLRGKERRKEEKKGRKMRKRKSRTKKMERAVTMATEHQHWLFRKQTKNSNYLQISFICFSELNCFFNILTYEDIFQL